MTENNATVPVQPQESSSPTIYNSKTVRHTEKGIVPAPFYNQNRVPFTGRCSKDLVERYTDAMMSLAIKREEVINAIIIGLNREDKKYPNFIFPNHTAPLPSPIKSYRLYQKALHAEVRLKFAGAKGMTLDLFKLKKISQERNDVRQSLDGVLGTNVVELLDTAQLLLNENEYRIKEDENEPYTSYPHLMRPDPPKYNQIPIGYGRHEHEGDRMLPYDDPNHMIDDDGYPDFDIVIYEKASYPPVVDRSQMRYGVTLDGLGYSWEEKLEIDRKKARALADKIIDIELHCYKALLKKKLKKVNKSKKKKMWKAELKTRRGWQFRLDIVRKHRAKYHPLPRVTKDELELECKKCEECGMDNSNFN